MIQAKRSARVPVSGAALAVLVAALWAASADASTSFPSQVDSHLKLTGAKQIEQTMPPPGLGCLLCHTTEVGGLGTNNWFGGLMKQHGAVGAQPETVGPALDAVALAAPQAIQDIQAGINPNDDPAAIASATSLPQPEYGCTTARSSASDGSWVPFAAIASLALARRRRVSGGR